MAPPAPAAPADGPMAAPSVPAGAPPSDGAAGGAARAPWGARSVAFRRLVVEPRQQHLGGLTPSLETVLSWLGVDLAGVAHGEQRQPRPQRHARELDEDGPRGDGVNFDEQQAVAFRRLVALFSSPPRLWSGRTGRS